MTDAEQKLFMLDPRKVCDSLERNARAINEAHDGIATCLARIEALEDKKTKIIDELEKRFNDAEENYDGQSDVFDYLREKLFGFVI